MKASRRVSADGLTPSEQLTRIAELAGKLVGDQQRVWTSLHAELREAGISVIEPDELSAADKEWLDGHFRNQIFPVLTPLAIDPAHPFPFIPNLGFSMALKLLRRRDGKALMALLPVPAQLSRFIRLPGDGKEVRFLPLEKVIGLYLDRLFPGHTVAGMGLFRILRDSDVEVEEEAEDLVLMFESLLKRRRRGSVIHMMCSQSMPDDLRRFIADHLQLKLEEFVFVEHMLGLADLSTADPQGAPRPAVQALCRALSRTHPRSRRRLLRGHPRQGHHRPSSVRELRRGGAVPAPGRRRSRRGGDQADALSHQRRFARSSAR